MKHLVILLSLFVLKSCGNAQEVAKASNTQNMSSENTLSGEFRIETLEGFNLDEALTLNFDATKNSVSGFSGCNRFVGSYKTKNKTISFSQIAVTKKLCQGKLNEIEQSFLNTLAEINAFEITDQGLTLFNDNVMLLQMQPQVLAKSDQNDDMSIVYKATTRGFFEQIWIEGNQIKFTTDRALKDIYSNEIPKDMFQDLKEAYRNIDLKTMTSVEPPSKKFTFDGAAMASLEIEDDGTTYLSQTFDHGNPPEAFQELVNILLSIKEKMVKP